LQIAKGSWRTACKFSRIMKELHAGPPLTFGTVKKAKKLFELLQKVIYYGYPLECVDKSKQATYQKLLNKLFPGGLAYFEIKC
jgi:hypothetical protein